MLVAQSGENVVVRLFDGEDVMQSLREVDLQGNAAVLLGAVGMVGTLGVGFWNGEAYEVHRVEEPAELLGLQGSIGTATDEGRVVHAHLSVGRRDGTVTGGHLIEAKAVNTVELVLRLLPGITLERKPEPSGFVGLYPRSDQRA